MTKKGGSLNNTRVNNVKANNSGNNLNSNSLKNTVNSVIANSNAANKRKNVIIGFLVLLGIVILIVAGYYLYRHLTDYKASEEKTKTLIPYIQDGKVERVIQSGSIPAPSQGNEFNMNFWIYVSDYNYRKEHDKCIIYRGSLVNSDSEINPLTNSSPDMTYERCNPGIWLLKYVNTLRIVVGLETRYEDNNKVCENFANQVQSDRMDQMDIPEGLGERLGDLSDEEIQSLLRNLNDPLAANAVVDQQSNQPVPTSSTTTEMPTTTAAPEANVEICDIENIPLQRWVNVNVSVHDNVIDVALDGQLVKSCILSGAPYISVEDSLRVSPKIGTSGASGGFNGYISNLTYTNKSLPLHRVYNTYKNGPTIKKGIF